jgi:hypothetical protein
MIIESFHFDKLAGAIAKSIAPIKLIGDHFGNPSVNLSNTMSKFHNKHDLQNIVQSGIKPPDKLTQSGAFLNTDRLSHISDRRILDANNRNR